jgi:diphthine-ammonia ligase
LTNSKFEALLFHTPNINLTALQAEAFELPMISVTTAGQKEEELAH